MHALSRCTHVRHRVAYIFSRSASTVSEKFPFPSHPRPTAYQIFHLPSGASQADIKARYYELVRSHHPDSITTHHLPEEERRRRFQAIQAAYDILRGKSPASPFGGVGADSPSAAWEYAAEVARRRARASAASSRRGFEEDWGYRSQRDWTASADDRWKDRMIVYFAVACVLIGFAPSFFYGPRYSQERHAQAVRALSAAREEADEVADVRREMLKQRMQRYMEERDRATRLPTTSSQPAPPAIGPPSDDPPPRLV